MNKRLTALIILVYAVAAAFVAAVFLFFQWRSPWVFTVPLALMAVTAGQAFAIIFGEHTLAPRAVLSAKLCLIPFFIVNWLIWLMSVMVFHIAMFALALLPIVMLYDYLLVLATSFHNIGWLVRRRQGGAITARQLTLHSLLQCLFVLDVADGLYLAAKQNQWHKV